MSTTPSKPSTKKSKLAIIHPDVVRIPRPLARVTMPIVTEPAIENGRVVVERTVRAEHALRAIAAIGRRDNTTRKMLWRNTAMNQRVGTKATKGGANTVALLHEVGVIEAYSRKTAGTPYTVTVAKVEDKQSLQLPLAALWVHRWADGNVTGPRYGKQTAIVARVLLGLLAYGDWSDDYTVVEWKRSNAFMTERLGLGKGTWTDWWAIFCKAVAKDKWITFKEGVDDFGGFGPWTVTIDWNRLPAMAAAPALPGKSTPVEVAAMEQSGSLSPAGDGSVSPVRGGSVSPDRVGHFSLDLKEDSAFRTVLSHTVPSSQRREQPAPKTANKKAGEGMKKAATVEDLRWQDTIRKGRKSQHAGDGGMDNTGTAYDIWLLAVVAILADPNTPNNLGLSLPDVHILNDILRPSYEAGWKPQPLATNLTRQSPPDILSKALPARVKMLPERVNHVDVAVDRKALADKKVHDQAASSRYADKYHQKTM